MKNTPRLGKVQLHIMQVLWERGEATAREITDELSRRTPIAHSTVQTLLRKLETKGAVTHTQQERTFVFRPLFREADVTSTATRDLVARVFNNSTVGLVAHLLQHEEITPQELRELRDLVEEKAKEVEAR